MLVLVTLLLIPQRNRHSLQRMHQTEKKARRAHRTSQLRHQPLHGKIPSRPTHLIRVGGANNSQTQKGSPLSMANCHLRSLRPMIIGLCRLKQLKKWERDTSGNQILLRRRRMALLRRILARKNRRMRMTPIPTTNGALPSLINARNTWSSGSLLRCRSHHPMKNGANLALKHSNRRRKTRSRLQTASLEAVTRLLLPGISCGVSLKKCENIRVFCKMAAAIDTYGTAGLQVRSLSERFAVTRCTRR